MKKKCYWMINAVVMAVSAVVLWNRMGREWNLWGMFLVCCAYGVGMLRLYMIFLESKINLKRYLRMYARTDVAEVLFPFWVSSPYRIYNFGYETSNYETGILGILIEKFFDLCVISVIFPAVYVIKGNLPQTIWVFPVTTVAVLVLYKNFEILYRYLNRFLILYTNSGKTPLILKQLECVHQWYEHSEQLLKGRGAALAGTTAVIWAVRILAFWSFPHQLLMTQRLLFPAVIIVLTYILKAWKWIFRGTEEKTDYE